MKQIAASIKKLIISQNTRRVQNKQKVKNSEKRQIRYKTGIKTVQS